MTTMTPEDQARMVEIREAVADPYHPAQSTAAFLLRLLDAATAGKLDGEMVTHSPNCPALRGADPTFIAPDGDPDCNCGLIHRRHLQTEQTMSAAWRKRATEAEAEVATLRTALTSLRQEATAQQAAAEGARAGHVLVPSDPTPEMVEAGRKAFAHGDPIHVSHARVLWIWMDMLAARPAATQPAAPKPIGEGGAKEAADDHAG